MKLFKNLRIIGKENNESNYIITSEGKFFEIGINDDYEKNNYDFKEVYDLKNNFVSAGFWDSHIHIVNASRSIYELNLRLANNFEEFKAALIDYCKNTAKGEFVLGHGWNQDIIFNGKFPDKYLLDEIDDKHPIILNRMDGHAAVLNSLAMKVLELENLEESEEVPYSDDGKPKGLFFENAMYEIDRRFDLLMSEDYLKELIIKGNDMLIKNGVTSINDIRTKYPKYLKAYNELYDSGDLKIRITAAADGEKESIDSFNKLEATFHEKLSLGPVKYFMDGTFGSRTALLSEDFSDDAGNSGLRLIEADDMDKIVEYHAKENRPFCIHALGDLAVTEVLDSFDRLKSRGISLNKRNRIEHLSVIQESDIERFEEHNIIPSFQGVFTFEEDMSKARVGDDRIKDMLRIKTFMDKGIITIVNSDCPYGGGDFPNNAYGEKYLGYEPLLGIYAAIYKNFNKGERISGKKALDAYTLNPAYANSKEDSIAQIKEGFLSDFIVLNNDITKEQSDEDFLKTKVLMTIIDDEVVYDSNEI